MALDMDLDMGLNIALGMPWYVGVQGDGRRFGHEVGQRTLVGCGVKPGHGVGRRP